VRGENEERERKKKLQEFSTLPVLQIDLVKEQVAQPQPPNHWRSRRSITFNSYKICPIKVRILRSLKDLRQTIVRNYFRTVGLPDRKLFRPITQNYKEWRSLVSYG